MADSLFLFEILVEELKCFEDCHNFNIRSRFADVFQINLRNPNPMETPKRLIKKKRKLKFRGGKNAIQKKLPDSILQMGQSILCDSKVDLLSLNMRQYPMEISLWRKSRPERMIASTLIPWSWVFIDYLSKLGTEHEATNVTVRGEHFIFDEYSSKRMANIKIHVKLSQFKGNFPAPILPTIEVNEKPLLSRDNISTTADTLNIITENQEKIIEETETGTIKTIYGGGKRRLDKPKPNSDEFSVNYLQFVDSVEIEEAMKEESLTEIDIEKEIMTQKSDAEGMLKETVSDDMEKYNKPNRSIVNLIRSKAEIDSNREVAVIRSKSQSSIDIKQRLDALDYIFGDRMQSFGNQVFCVGYVSVEKDKSNHSVVDVTPTKTSLDRSPSSSREKSPQKSALPSVSATTSSLKVKYKFRLCDSECPNKDAGSECSLDLPENLGQMIHIQKCKTVECDERTGIPVPSTAAPPILLDFGNVKKDCCEKIEEVIGGIAGKLRLGDKPCYCSCECTFGFVKKTTYCGVCGGYEVPGEDLTGQMPFPCPIFHKLAEKSKFKPLSTSGSDNKRKTEDSQKVDKVAKATVKGSADKPAKALEKNAKGVERLSKGTLDKKSVESDKDTKKGKKKKMDQRFKFNYGYKGIPPQIGHSQCAMPCTGSLGPVPKNMGWLWTAENVLGMKFRPLWRPGAANKHVVRLLKIARNPEQVTAKRRKRDSGKKKRSPKRPLLIVHKKDGEYTVTMETMKAYTKPRAPNQIPYEDKPLVTYTIGRTDEENRERRKRREREHRRLEREQREFIQSTFHDMCHEICLKTYQQALGILPDAEDPECTCYPADPDKDRTNLEHSCSCSDQSKNSLFLSDTDSDEWIVEFTPPTAQYDPMYKTKKVIKTENATQYTYLDYKVKLLDRFGNPVQRFFTGPDGKQKCSDLGGFWSPDHKWLEINVDGYVAPDGRWAPNNFIGPSGEHVDAETGKFQSTNGTWLVVGVDGFVDGQGRWRWYPKGKTASEQKKRAIKKAEAGDKKGINKQIIPKMSEASWSCFGDATPKELSEMGVVGHGQDRKLLLATLEKMMAQGENVKIPQASILPRMSKKTGKMPHNNQSSYDTRNYYSERLKCRHPTPSNKGILADDGRGHKTYFTLIDEVNKRPRERVAALGSQGISLSSFHVPCFSSFINSESMRQQQLEHILQHNAKVMMDVAT